MPLPSLAPNTWSALPGTSLQAAGVIPTTLLDKNGVPQSITGGAFGGNAGADMGIMTDWCGGCYAEELETLFVHGDGHSSGPISGIFGFKLGSTQLWSKEPNQSSAYNINDALNNGVNPDGSPSSVHSYGNQVYLPTKNEFLRNDLVYWSPGGSSGSTLWAWDLTNKTWRIANNGIGGERPGFPGWWYSYNVALVMGDALYAYDPANNSVSQITAASSQFPNRGWVVVDFKRGIAYAFDGVDNGAVFVHGANKVSIVNINKPWPKAEFWSGGTVFNTTGTAPFDVTNYPRWITGFFDDVRDVVVKWNGGKDIWTMDANPASVNYLQWTKVTGLGDDPGQGLIETGGSRDVQAHYNRFFRSRTRDLYGLVTDTHANVFIYKPATPTGWLTVSDGWTVKPAPTVGTGPIGASKHTQWTKNLKTGKWYPIFGDFHNVGHANSYPQIMHAVDLAAWLAGDNNAGWSTEQGYCRGDGNIQPKHQDTTCWGYDPTRDKFFLLPGLSQGSGDVCPGETTAYAADPLFFWDDPAMFDPNTKLWTILPNTGNARAAGGFQTGFCPYDYVSDQFIQCTQMANGSGIQGYRPGANPAANGQWVTLATNLRDSVGQNVHWEGEYKAWDWRRRTIYGISFRGPVDDFDGKCHFMKYDLRTGTLTDLGVMDGQGGRPTAQQQGGVNYNGCVYDGVNDVVWYYPHPYVDLNSNNIPVAVIPRALYGWHLSGPLAGTWETISTDTGFQPGDAVDSYAVGRELFFDDERNVLVLFAMGDTHDNRDQYYYLYRYPNTPVVGPAVTLRWRKA